jgi:AAA+ superfamily predicted ATPase
VSETVELTPVDAKANMNNLDDKKIKESFLNALAQFSSSSYTADDGVAYHKEPKNKISLPEGMTPEKGAQALIEVATANAEKQNFVHSFKYRPWDGAYALQKVLHKFFGTTGRGKPIQTMFGPIPPQTIEIEVGVAENGTIQTAQIPWGHIAFAYFDGHMELGTTHDEDYGLLFSLTVNCPKKYAAAIHGFFNLIEAMLAEESIYKGQSIRGTDQPRFINVKTNPTIVYNEEVDRGLRNTVWGVIENAELLKEDNRRVNNRVLLHGPYGTGKSECGMLTAKVANNFGWTFIQFKSGQSSLDDLESTIATAKLMSPCVVFIEDIDIYASKEGPNAQTRITNLFDGIGSKGDEVMIVMTSNRAADFSKGMLRAGRVDRMIEIGPLGREATEELIRRVIGADRLEKDIDFDKVWEAMKGFEPAFVRQTFDQAATAALIRTKSRKYVLATEDLVGAAELLRPQHDLHSNKAEREKHVTIDQLVIGGVAQALAERVQFNLDGEQIEVKLVEA